MKWTFFGDRWETSAVMKLMFAGSFREYAGFILSMLTRLSVPLMRMVMVLSSLLTTSWGPL